MAEVMIRSSTGKSYPLVSEPANSAELMIKPKSVNNASLNPCSEFPAGSFSRVNIVFYLHLPAVALYLTMDLTEVMIKISTDEQSSYYRWSETMTKWNCTI